MTEYFFPAPKPEYVPKKKPKGVKPINSARKKELFAKNFGSKEHRARICSHPCAICGIEGLSEPAHIKTRGSGGTAENNIVPLCGNRHGVVGCHRLFDTYDESARKHEPNLKRLAKRLYADFLESQSAGSKRA